MAHRTPGTSQNHPDRFFTRDEWYRLRGNLRQALRRLVPDILGRRANPEPGQHASQHDDPEGQDGPGSPAQDEPTPGQDRSLRPVPGLRRLRQGPI